MQQPAARCLSFFERKRAISSWFQSVNFEARLTVEKAALAPRVDAPLLHVGLELERDDEQAAVAVRVRSRRRIVRRVDVHDPRADLDSAVRTGQAQLRGRLAQEGKKLTGTWR